MCEIWLGGKKSREESQVIRGRRPHEGRTPGTGKQKAVFLTLMISPRRDDVTFQSHHRHT